MRQLYFGHQMQGVTEFHDGLEIFFLGSIALPQKGISLGEPQGLLIGCQSFLILAFQGQGVPDPGVAFDQLGIKRQGRLILPHRRDGLL